PWAPGRERGDPPGRRLRKALGPPKTTTPESVGSERGLAAGAARGVEGAPGVGQPPDRVGRLEARAEALRELLEKRPYARQAERVRPAQEPAEERRKSRAQDHREIELRRSGDDPVLQAEGRLVDHRQSEARFHLVQRERR